MRSTSYTFAFAAIVCVVCSLVVSGTATLLRERQEQNVRLDIQKNILRSVGFLQDEKASPERVKELYTSSIQEIVVDTEGNVVEGRKPGDLDARKDSGLFAVYIRKDDGEVAAYALPISGKGLWSTIYGYLALKPDCSTVKGITFYKHGETPGLGGEIEAGWFLNNFKDKKILDSQGRLVSIKVFKGKIPKDASPDHTLHCVDGISGATLTGKGVTRLIRAGLERYEPFLKKVRKKP